MSKSPLNPFRLKTASLQGNLSSTLGILKQNIDIRLDELSYTTTAQRMHYLHLVMLVGSRTEEICDHLIIAIRDDIGTKRPKSEPKIVFTFTGYGALYHEMGRQLLVHLSCFRNEVLRFDHIEQSLGFPSVLTVTSLRNKTSASLLRQLSS